MIYTLEFAYMRSEKTNQYTLFLKVDNSFLDKDLDIELNNEKKLIIKSNSDSLYATHKLPEEIFQSLAYSKTLAVFTDANGEFLAQQELIPLLAVPNVKKNKP